MTRTQIGQLWARWQVMLSTLAIVRAPRPELTQLQQRLLAMGLAHANPSTLGRRRR